MPVSLGVPLEFDRSFVFWPEGPCFASDGAVRPMPRSRSEALHGKVAQLM